MKEVGRYDSPDKDLGHLMFDALLTTAFFIGPLKQKYRTKIQENL